MTHTLKTTCIALIAGAGFSHAALLSDFNTVGWTSDFAAVNTGNYTHFATEGTGGSGAISPNNSTEGGNIVYDATSFDLTSIGETLELTLDFRITATGDVVADGNPTVRLGVGDDTTGSLSGRIFGDFDVTSINSGGGTVNGRLDLNGGTLSSSFDLDLDTWYTLYFSWETTGGTSGDLSGTSTAHVYEFGTTTLADANSTLSTGLTNRLLDGDNYVNIRADDLGNNKSTYLDNLAVIPEPSSLALLGVAVGAMLLMRKQK